MKERPCRQMAVIGTNLQTGEQIYFRSAYYTEGFDRNGIKEAISGRAKSHRGFTWRYATRQERNQHTKH
ncbi:MAG: hypothetical protein QM578_09540 [Pantoea sp.]|uniref:hypothetical protein n=1 Tax=Pantoea sp. TaxID=69393 RepID=UPI0039E5B8C4